MHHTQQHDVALLNNVTIEPHMLHHQPQHQHQPQPHCDPINYPTMTTTCSSASNKRSALLPPKSLPQIRFASM